LPDKRPLVGSELHFHIWLAQEPEALVSARFLPGCNPSKVCSRATFSFPEDIPRHEWRSPGGKLLQGTSITR
jgi:hypothetical protein